MDYLITASILGIWAFVWYKFGYVQAELKESNTRIREIYRKIQFGIEDIKREVKECKKLLEELSDNYEENINRP